MAKKKDTLYDKLWEVVELQELRIKEIASKFYPDDVLVEFTEVPQVLETMLGCPKLMDFASEPDCESLCKGIVAGVVKGDALCIDIDFLKKRMCFQNTLYDDFKGCVMMKTAPEDDPVYMYIKWDTWFGTLMRFLVDSETKDAFLVLDGEKTKFTPKLNLNGMCQLSYYDSFIKLWEFQAIIAGFRNDGTDDPELFLISFSREDGRCIMEKIFEFNIEIPFKLVKLGSYSDYGKDETTTEDDANEPAVKDGTSPQPKANDDETITKNDANE